MPAKPRWFKRLPVLIETARRHPDEQYLWDRHVIEKLFEVGRTEATRLMMAFGRSRIGNVNLVYPSKVAEWLEALRDGEDYDRWEAGRRKVAVAIEESKTQLDDTVRALAAHEARERVVVRDRQAATLMDTRIASLPPNVSLTPGRLVIDFNGTEHFLASLGAVVYAVQNDFGGIQAICEQVPRR